MLVSSLIRRSGLLAGLVVSLYLALGGAGTAWANGRFPEADAIVSPVGATDPALARTLFLRATFGVVVSRDAGKTWHWICEQTFGFSGTWDPPLAVTRDGRLWVGLADGLRSSLDGCSTEHHAALRGETVADLTLDPTGASVVALVATPSRPGRVVWLDPAGKEQGTLRAVGGVKLDTVEVAPSAPKRVYVTGISVPAGPRGRLFRGERGDPSGRLVEVHPQDVPPGTQLLVSAIDPQDPDRILLRGLSAEGSDVLLSTDGGKTLHVVLHIKSSMFGFAKSDDGATYWAGSGDPTDGVYRSRDRGKTWEPMAKVRVFCLHAHGHDLYACSSPYRPDGFAVAVSHDGGATFERLNRFDDIAGPVACEAGAGAVCGAGWPEVHASLLPRPPSSDIILPDAAASAPADAAPPPRPAAPAKPTHASCGCRTVGAERSTLTARSSTWWLTLGLLVLPLALRRRLDRDGPNPSP